MLSASAALPALQSPSASQLSSTAALPLSPPVALDIPTDVAVLGGGAFVLGALAVWFIMRRRK